MQKLLIGLAIGITIFLLSAAQTAEPENLVYELRTYTTNDGKLDDLHNRFRDHTLALFEKHGMKNIGYWVPEDKENTLIYIIAHNNREAADKSWQSFIDDPEWKKVWEASNVDGKIVAKIDRVFMTGTDYSAIK